MHWHTDANALIQEDGGERYVEVRRPDTQFLRSAWTWDAVGSLDTDDYPIDLRMEIEHPTILTQHNELLAHVSGTTGAENAYVATWLSDARALIRYRSGSTTTLSQSSFTQSNNVRYQLRLQVYSGGVRHKIWLANADEPGAWRVSSSDTALTSGRVGIGAVATVLRRYNCYWFGVGTGGDDAPDEPLQPDPPTGLNLQSTGPHSISVTWNEPD